MKGKSITLLIPSYRPEELPQLYDKIKRGETISWNDTVRLRKDGQTFDVALTLSPIKDAVGKSEWAFRRLSAT